MIYPFDSHVYWDISDFPQFPDEGGSTDTYCKVCNLECKTAKALATHIKSKSHKIRAAEKNDDNEEEKQEGMETDSRCLNSFAPGRLERNFRYVIFKVALMIDGWCITCEITHRWM